MNFRLLAASEKLDPRRWKGARAAPDKARAATPNAVQCRAQICTAH